METTQTNKEQTHFFNTINATDSELELYQKKSISQESIVLEFFKTNSIDKYTCEDVWLRLQSLGKISMRVPKDSIKRAISVLKRSNKLIKLSEMKLGEYGKPNHYFILNNDTQKLC